MIWKMQYFRDLENAWDRVVTGPIKTPKKNDWAYQNAEEMSHEVPPSIKSGLVIVTHETSNANEDFKTGAAKPPKIPTLKNRLEKCSWERPLF